MRRSSLEHRADLAIRHGIFREGERAILAHLPAGAEECPQRGARKRAADAHPLDADLGQLGEAQLDALKAHYDVHRAIDGAYYGGDVLAARQAGGVKHVGSRLLISLEP